ncbi:zinc dependent phospholipase C family protein [Candidatus Woesearchaeota archaeon]|nr:zinc dependent phospholipase C family protein [Candidatus Woesearchaeota archaeon]
MKYFILLIVLLLIPQVHAWKWETHQNIIEYIYFNLPIEAQQQLNITKLKEGSITPDKDFKDHKLHHYPKSLIEAEKWLNNDTDISFNMGIASHYITDSFAAPHNINGEDYKLHSAFENQVKNYYPNTKCYNYKLKIQDLSKGTKTSEEWKIWLKTKDRIIPEKEVDESTKLLFSIILNKLNLTCIKNTEIEEVSYINKRKIILISLVSLIGLYFLKN